MAKIRILITTTILSALICFTDGAHNAKRDGRSNIRIKDLSSVYDNEDKAYYKDLLIFPVERWCKASGAIEPNLPEGLTSELVPLWSDLLNKFTFANEELIPDRAVRKLEEAATHSPAYKKLPWMPIFVLLMYAAASFLYIIAIPVLGCVLFFITDSLWVYCTSIVFRKLGRLAIIGFYRSKIEHIKQTKPEQLGVYHFRIPKYFRNVDDAEEILDKQTEEEAKAVAAGEAKPQPLSVFNDSSDSDFDLERDYKDVAPDDEEGDAAAGGMTEAERKAHKKETRRLFKHAKGRRQSIRLSVAGDLDLEASNSSSDEDLGVWDTREVPGAIKDKPLDPRDIQRSRKTLLQEMRDERMGKLLEEEAKSKK